MAAAAKDIKINEDGITLGQFLKLSDLAGTGSEAKDMIAAGVVTVDGEKETKRGRQLARGSVVAVAGRSARVA